MADGRRSAFGPVDQQAILANLDLVNEDPVESRFFQTEEAEENVDVEGPPGLADESPAARKDFILYGPAGLNRSDAVGATR